VILQNLFWALRRRLRRSRRGRGRLSGPASSIGQFGSFAVEPARRRSEPGGRVSGRQAGLMTRRSQLKEHATAARSPKHTGALRQKHMIALRKAVGDGGLEALRILKTPAIRRRLLPRDHRRTRYRTDRSRSRCRLLRRASWQPLDAIQPRCDLEVSGSWTVLVGLLRGLGGETGSDHVGEVGACGDVVVWAVQCVGESFLGGMGLGDLLVEVGELALGESSPAPDGLCS
jgi:hypothetical protein